MTPFSFNEVETLAKKAAKGSGLSWGLAEEAGRATRLLECNHLNGVETLLKLFNTVSSDQLSSMAPLSLEPKQWHSKSDFLHPIITGASILDCAFLFENQDEQIDLKNVIFPLLLLPFALQISLRQQEPIMVIWNDVFVHCEDYAISLKGDCSKLYTTEASDVIFQPSKNLFKPKPFANQSKISNETWQGLTEFAQRTYAPATAQSRDLGAGSNLDDND